MTSYRVGYVGESSCSCCSFIVACNVALTIVLSVLEHRCHRSVGQLFMAGVKRLLCLEVCKAYHLSVMDV